jgi:hypothetical protein
VGVGLALVDEVSVGSSVAFASLPQPATPNASTRTSAPSDVVRREEVDRVTRVPCFSTSADQAAHDESRARLSERDTRSTDR